MKASILDLRYKTRDILAALANGEKVTEDPFFGMKSAPDISVEEIMDNLRGKRHDL